MRFHIREKLGGKGIRIHDFMGKPVFSCNVHDHRKDQRLQHLLCIFLLIGIFNDHKIQKMVDWRILWQGKMDEFIGVCIGRRIQKKTDERGI